MALSQVIPRLYPKNFGRAAAVMVDVETFRFANEARRRIPWTVVAASAISPMAQGIASGMASRAARLCGSAFALANSDASQEALTLPPRVLRSPTRTPRLGQQR
jgi:hypothetical protein